MLTHHHNLFRGVTAESGQILHDRDIRLLFSFRSYFALGDAFCAEVAYMKKTRLCDMTFGEKD